MAEILDELEAQALRLPPNMRGELIHRLMVSLDDEPMESPEIVAKAWDDEIGRRIDEMDAGTVELIPNEKVFEKIEKRLKEAGV